MIWFIPADVFQALEESAPYSFLYKCPILITHAQADLYLAIQQYLYYFLTGST